LKNGAEPAQKATALDSRSDWASGPDSCKDLGWFTAEWVGFARKVSLMLILLIIVIVLLFGGGGGYYYGRGAGWGAPHYGGGLLGLVLIILLILWLTGNLGGPVTR